jgi:large subunit ribosomal protein L18
MALSKQDRRLKIKRRIRKKIFGTPDKPRLSVYRSNKHISVQIIDDVNGKTLLSVTSESKGITENSGITKKERAELVGKLIAEKAVEAGINNIAFDRNGYLYHGRVKSLAEAARSGGLKF